MFLKVFIRFDVRPGRAEDAEDFDDSEAKEQAAASDGEVSKRLPSDEEDLETGSGGQKVDEETRVEITSSSTNGERVTMLISYALLKQIYMFGCHG